MLTLEQSLKKQRGEIMSTYQPYPVPAPPRIVERRAATPTLTLHGLMWGAIVGTATGLAWIVLPIAATALTDTGDLADAIGAGLVVGIIYGIYGVAFGLVIGTAAGLLIGLLAGVVVDLAVALGVPAVPAKVAAFVIGLLPLAWIPVGLFAAREIGWGVATLLTLVAAAAPFAYVLRAKVLVAR